jgi:hypothetical protein
LHQGTGQHRTAWVAETSIGQHKSAQITTCQHSSA